MLESLRSRKKRSRLLDIFEKWFWGLRDVGGQAQNHKFEAGP